MTTMTMDQFRRQVFHLYQQGAYAEALQIVTAQAPTFPEALNDISFWRMALASRLNDVGLALQIMADRLQAGSWFSPYVLKNDEDFKDLQGEPQFERMVAECEERHRKAQEGIVPVRVSLQPATVKAAAPLLLAFHGNGHNAEQEAHHWRPLVAKGWRVTLPQSSQITGPDQFVWNDYALAEREALQHYAELCAESQPSETVLGGFSMGAGTAIRLALSGAIKAKGFIAVGPYLPDVEVLRPPMAGVRGYIIVGEQDHCFESAKATKALLAEYGIPCELEVHPDLDHSYPENFERSLERALQFING